MRPLIAVALLVSASWAATTPAYVAPDLQQLMQGSDSELRVIVSYRQDFDDDELESIRSRGGREVQRLDASQAFSGNLPMHEINDLITYNLDIRQFRYSLCFAGTIPYSTAR